MNYLQALTKAQTLLQQKHHAQAVQTAASALENLLIDLYNDLLGQSPLARQNGLVQAIEVGGGQPLGKFTLGKLVGLYRASKAYEDLAKTLGLNLNFLNVNALGPLVDIRNQAVNEGREPDPAEAAYVVNQVELILRETNRLPAVPRPAERGGGAEGLQPWWFTAIPHRDILEGRLNLRDFAIDLAQVVEGQAVPEYKDAHTFFRRTFLTRGLRPTLRGVLRRLAGRDGGVAITQMATVFGGGKTHTLLALYHTVRHGAEVVTLMPVQELLAEAGLDALPGAQVAAVDCAQVSPSQLAHVNLDNGEIRAELLEYVDHRGGYKSAIFSDIGGTDESKAPYLDRLASGDYARYRIATGLATAIFMYSHSGATQRAASVERPQLWLATLQPGIVPALTADGMDKLRARLWYLVAEGTYRFDSQPNLNQMLVSRMDEVRERIRAAVEEITGERTFPGLNIWPEELGQVTNHRHLTLVLLDPAHSWGPDEPRPQATGTGQKQARAFIESILNSAGNTFHQFKNALVFLLPTAKGVRVMEETTVRLLALEAIDRQYKSDGLSGEQMEELRTQLDRARKGLPGAVWGAYTVTIASSRQAETSPADSSTLPGQTSLWVRQEHGFPGYRPGEHTPAGRVRKRLMDDQRLLERLDPRLIAEGKGDQSAGGKHWRLWPAEEAQINVATLWDYFCRFPYLPMLTGLEALQQTIAWGVQRDLFAYTLGNGSDFDTIYFQDTLPTGVFAVVEGAWLLRPALAEQLLKKEAPQPEPQPQPQPQPGGQPVDQITPPVKPPAPRPSPPTPGPVAPPPAVYAALPSPPRLTGSSGTTSTRPSSSPWLKPAPGSASTCTSRPAARLTPTWWT